MRALLVILALTLAHEPARSRRDLLIVHPDRSAPVELEPWRRSWRWPRWNVTSVAASKVTQEELAQRSIALVGTSVSNRWIRELAPKEFAEWYDRPGYLVQISQRNPLNRAYRMTIMAGETDGPIPRRRADVHIRRDGFTTLLGFRQEDGSFEIRPFELATHPQLVTDSFRFFVHGFDVSDAALRRFTRSGPRAPRIAVHVYPSLEEKGLVTDDTRSAHMSEGVYHIVLGVDERPARLLAETGDGPLLLKRGRAALHAYDRAELDRLDEVARRVMSLSTRPSLAELLDDTRFDATSPFITEAVAASFARFADDREPDVEKLGDAWTRALAEKKPRSYSFAPPRGFQHGFTYTHEGYQIHNGYLSERSDAALSQLQQLGIDAVAVVPYTFMSAPKEIVSLEVPRRAGSETDEDIAHVVRRARERGMTVLLKPQIWVRQSWPGEIEGTTPAEEDRVFREYGEWIRHYALMAQELEVPLFAIGTELAKLTHGHRHRWQTLIEDIRQLYSGKLVYAANWGKEVQQVDFWDLLDYIGVDFYYPLSAHEHPSDEELEKGFEAALGQVRALHERHRKPVILTEIGYASTKSPWKKPHASDQEHELSPEDQARAYEIAFRCLADETDWIHGMYWWKWPTDLRRGGDGHRGFTPNGKAAEDVLRRWYGSRLQ